MTGKKLRLLIKREGGFFRAQGNDCSAKFFVPFNLPCKGFSNDESSTARVGKATEEGVQNST